MVGYEDRHCLEQQYNVTLWSLPLHCDCTILLWGSGSWEPGNSWNTPGAPLSFAQSILNETVAVTLPIKSVGHCSRSSVPTLTIEPGTQCSLAILLSSHLGASPMQRSIYSATRIIIIINALLLFREE